LKTLILLRHAKSSWDDMAIRDVDRRLNDKGERAATTMGRHLRTIGLAWDHAIASPAARVQETLAHVAGGLGRAIEPVWDRRVYLASAATLIDLIRQLPDSAGTVLLAGHNPGLEDLVLLLTPDRADDGLRGDVEAKFPTASLAVLTLPIDHWADLTEGSATLTRFTRPRDLDPTLGPDGD